MRHAATAVALATVMTAGLVGSAAAPARAQATADAGVPAAASAAWLAGLLGPDAVVVDPALGVEDVDATLDLLLGLVAADAAADVRAAVADRLTADVAVHTGASIDATFVSATAKLTLVLDAAGRDPRDVGGTDLVALLAGRVGTDGRATDRSALGDLSTPASQALAVLALARAGADPAVVLRAADALTVAACADGGMPAEFDADPCATDAVTTALGAAALGAAAGAAGADPALVAARDDALAVLLDLDAAGDLDAWAAGITATALRGAGRAAEADTLAAALAARLDGCEGDATAALLATVDPLRGTVGALLAASGATLIDLTADGDTAAVALDCAAAVDAGDGAAPAAAGETAAASDPGAADAGDGEDSTGRTVVVAVAVGVLALALLAGLPVLRSARRRDAAERTGARRA